jgi:hypothetical protein
MSTKVDIIQFISFFRDFGFEVTHIERRPTVELIHGWHRQLVVGVAKQCEAIAPPLDL